MLSVNVKIYDDRELKKYRQEIVTATDNRK